MSVSGDGKMLVWKFDRKTKKLELNNGYVNYGKYQQGTKWFR